MTASTHRPTPARSQFRPRRPRRPRRGASFGLVITLLAADGAVIILNPTVGTVLLACETGLPLLVILIAVLGPAETGDRAFRLLRWMTDRPEPPGNPAPERQNRSEQDHQTVFGSTFQPAGQRSGR